jgi:hypothetical protein
MMTSYVRCNNCFHLQPGTGDDTPCPVCKAGHLRQIDLHTTPEAVERSRAELEADRARHDAWDKRMLHDPDARGHVPTLDDRLREGFAALEGEG